MENNVKRYGIMGGTFDPIHIGHLVTAEAAMQEFDLDRVFFVPSGNPPHKVDKKVSAPEHRYLMCFLSVVSNPKFRVSRLEIDRLGFSYTIETIKEFRKRLGKDAEIYFITGADAIKELKNWYKADEILQMCHFVAATRPNYSLESFMATEEWLKPYQANVHPLKIPGMEISSTEIRGRVRQGKSIKYLVYETVESFIYKNKLYV